MYSLPPAALVVKPHLPLPPSFPYSLLPRRPADKLAGGQDGVAEGLDGVRVREEEHTAMSQDGIVYGGRLLLEGLRKRDHGGLCACER